MDFFILSQEVGTADTLQPLGLVGLLYTPFYWPVPKNFLCSWQKAVIPSEHRTIPSIFLCRPCSVYCLVISARELGSAKKNQDALLSGS